MTTVWSMIVVDLNMIIVQLILRACNKLAAKDLPRKVPKSLCATVKAIKCYDCMKMLQLFQSYGSVDQYRIEWCKLYSMSSSLDAIRLISMQDDDILVMNMSIRSYTNGIKDNLKVTSNIDPLSIKAGPSWIIYHAVIINEHWSYNDHNWWSIVPW